jgi:hypothetical protein
MNARSRAGIRGQLVGMMRVNVTTALIGFAIGVLTSPGMAMDSRDVPDPNLTPGLVASADVGQICASDGRPGSAYSRAHREMNEADRRADFARYGIAWADRHGYEDDHLVPLCLGGADAAANRWPEPGWGLWNYREKDKLEGYA